MLIYTETEKEALLKRANTARFIAVNIFMLTVIACIILCAMTGTGNAESMLYITVAVSTAGGWVAILIYNLVFRPAIAEYRHMAGLNGCETTVTEGTLISADSRFHIPKSIDIIKVRIAVPDGIVSLNLLERKKELLPGIGTKAVFIAARGYITEVKYAQH